MAANKELLFGKIALGKGYCTADQIDKALAIQVASAGDLQLGEILVSEGYLTAEQNSEILALQKQAFGVIDPVLKRDQEAILFGKLALSEGLITEDDLNECLRVQGREGERRSLGEIMVELKYLTPTQVHQVLSKQEKKIMSCSPCQLSFTVLTITPGKAVRCPRCRGELQAGKPSESIRTDAEFDTTIVRAIKSEHAPESRSPQARHATITCLICRKPFEGAMDSSGRMRCPHCHATFSF